jgi:hypothetical protein
LPVVFTTAPAVSPTTTTVVAANLIGAVTTFVARQPVNPAPNTQTAKINCPSRPNGGERLIS